MTDSAETVVVIGASLGGVKALKQILPALPAGYAGAVAVVQHRGPESGDAFARLLDRSCTLPVSEPDDWQEIERGHVYVAPPDYHLMIERGRFALSVDAPVHHVRPSIDVLFETAGRAYGQRLTAMLLTAANEDGARGIEDVRRYGGFTIVQNPDEAESPIAVQAALSRGPVHRVWTLQEIAAWMHRR